MGFQHMREAERKAAQRKGGKKKVLKGIGKVSREKQREITSLGGKTSRGNRYTVLKKQQEGQGREPVPVADIPGTLDE